MKTFVPFKKRILKCLLLVPVNLAFLFAQGQSSTSFVFNNPTLQSGTDLQAGARYLFSYVQPTVDAVVSIDSLVNGAKVNQIDDNSNGTGYKDAFQPAIQSGGVTGVSYVVFTINFYVHGTTTPKVIDKIYPTAIDIDGNNTLKEFARINVGPGGLMNYLPNTTDISITPVASGDFFGQNILGVERSGIDTSSLANMFTAINSNLSSFTLRYGSITINPSTAVRQYSLYMKPFYYPGSTLPVKLASFTATLNNTKADLKWTTAAELNVSHFTVEKSLDGINFTDAGIVFASGNTMDAMNYNFSDNLSATTAPVVYYRLRTVDIDGKTDYSAIRIIRLTRSKTNDISIITYPNPVTNELRITVPANWQNKAVVYEVFTIGGQLMKRMQTGNSGQTETVNTSNLAPGMYLVKVNCEGVSAVQRIVKQ